MKCVAKFKKVSLRQFFEGYAEYASTHPECSKNPLEAYKKIKLPKRATSGSAGYDFFAPVDITLHPGDTVKIPTGIRAKIEPGWVLMCYPRSGLGFKYRLQLDNTVGIIDSDYYGSDNEGHIFLKLTNDTNQGKVVEIKAGTGIAQGIFMEFGITEDDDATEIRNGGFGSTSKSEDNSVGSTGVVDDDLLCEGGDIIDNAVFNVIATYTRHDSYDRFVDAVIDAGKALCIDDDSDDVKTLMPLIADDVEAEVIKLVERHKIVPKETPEWNMEIIGSLTMFVEAIMEKHGVRICHPWEDDDEHICYSTSDRCEYCNKPHYKEAVDPDRTYEVTEVCPECESENSLHWNTDVDGYEAYCPHCGSKMMLCDECKHSEDNQKGICDWSDSEVSGGFCFRMKKEN